MIDEPQPEYVWAFPPERPRNARKVWLIVLLALVAVAIAAGLFWLFVRPGMVADPRPTDTATASPDPSPTETASPSPSATPTVTPTSLPTAAPTTPPPPADPDLPAFRGKVAPLLRDAETGLSFASDSRGQDGVQLADELIGDAGLMADAVAPSSLADEWSRGVDAYAEALQQLRTAYESGAGPQTAIDRAGAALADLNALIG
ncbi:hypothetical protein [Microbacterium sp.]|uniref:hypothetical protein n=1 Tax=Microbacterium sp. TaxID=51671 RepID=UPI00281219E8|nr:hypothetical protein [Microbacterium sp.]